MGFLVVVGIVLWCYYSNKQGGAKRQTSNDRRIDVVCPHCNGKVYISHEGAWNCPHCKKNFTYYEKKNSQSNSAPNLNNYNGGMHVHCPYCNNDVSIESEGSWICPYCKESFIYRYSRVYKKDEACNDAVISMVKVIAKLSKADGVVTQKEISLLGIFLDNELNLSFSQKKEVQEIFNREKQNYLDYEKDLRKLYDIFSNNREMLLAFVEEMFKFSYEDGGVHPEQEKIILKAVEIFGLSVYDYQEIKNKYVEELDKYYSVLNCNVNSTNEEIKSSYRKLMLTYHPDKYVSKDLPEEMIKLAKEKTQEIQEAYEKIRKSRNF